MITESGRVVLVEQDCLWVETIQRSACDTCSSKKGCGQQVISRWSRKNNFIRVLLEGRDPEEYRIDDDVVIGIPENIIANSSLLVYLTPLIAMIIGLGVADSIGGSEAAAMFGALGGFLAGAALVYLYNVRHKNDPRFQPVIVDQQRALLCDP